MPFIKIKVNCEISLEQELEIKRQMGKAIELVPNKNEEFLLSEFEDRARIWLAGKNNTPIAYIEAAIFANEKHSGYDNFSIEITRIFSEILSINPQNIFIKYEDILVWSVAGFCIDRTKYNG